MASPRCFKPDSQIVAPKASKKEGIEQRIENLKLSRLKETRTRKELKGRESDLQDITRKLSGTKPILNLYGSGGVGKTTLGKEICLKWPGMQIPVDLRGVTEMKDVYFHVMRASDTNRTVMAHDENPVIEKLRKLLKEGQGDVLLLLDNVDHFSGTADAASTSVFTDFLQRLLDYCYNGKSGRDEKQEKKGTEKNQLKVVLVSRERFHIESKRKKRKEKGRSLEEAIDYKELKVLDAGVSAEIFKSACGTTTVEDVEMATLVELCNGNPLFLNLTAAALRRQIADAKTLLEMVEQEEADTKAEHNAVSTAEDDKKETVAWDYGREGIGEGQLSCLRRSFFVLPNDTLKHSAIALSLFCGPFTLEAAASVLGEQTSEAAKLLDDLRNSELLSAEEDETGLVYDIHAVKRSYLKSLGDGPVYGQVLMKAKSRFGDLYLRKINEMAAKLDDDCISVFNQFDVDIANLELALEISIQTEYLHVIPNEYHESMKICYLFEAMLNESQRRRIFQSWAEATGEDGKEGSLFRAQMRCQVALQVLTLEGWKPSMKTLTLADDSLKSVNDDLKSSRGYRLVRSLYLFVEGEICYRSGNIPRALKSLFSALKIMDEVLNSHTSTTRCLNAIGNCYSKLGDSEKALSFYTRAYEMRRELSGTKNHLDLPLFKGQIGTVYESRKQYDKAIECYEEALELAKELKISAVVRVAFFLRNIANAYTWQKEFEKAYKSAIVAYEIRKDILGNHRDTARSAFQLGLICGALDEFEEAEDFYAEAWEIEKTLGNTNHSEVRDRIVQAYESYLRGHRRKEFQREALEFYQHLWEDQTEFSYANKVVINEINARLRDLGTRETIKKYKSESLRFYEEAWNSPDLKELPSREREGILQTILELCKGTRQTELHKKYQSEALAFYEQLLEEQTTMPKKGTGKTSCTGFNT